MLQPMYFWARRAIISTPPVVPPYLKIMPSPTPINTPANKRNKEHIILHMDIDLVNHEKL